MPASPSHKTAMSVSNSSSNLAPPPQGSSVPKQQRRMTSPSLPPPSPLNLPEPVNNQRRPPSPLRNGVTMDGEGSESGDSDQEGQWGERPQSPSVAQYAANFAQRVGSLVSNMSARSPNYLPTDEELEAEAERERDRSRREAERILSREADSRRLEERVLAMLDDDRGSPKSLPPPPPRSLTMPGTPPSPSASQKEAGWWAAAKSRLTPTKESLTPAQQIIQDTKVREKELEKEKKEIAREQKELEKEMKKAAKKMEKQKSKDSREWPSAPDSKFDDPAFLKLGIPPVTPPRPMSTSPSSPTPFRGVLGTPPSLMASPLRAKDSAASSPSRSAPPVYAEFNSQGALDIPGTLLTVAKRFEKLERWTVSHVRALEERMDDVERWLVEKEREKETTHAKPMESQQTGEPGSTEAALSELREEISELQGRIGELGREMAKLVTAPGNLSSGPPRGSGSMGRAPSTSSSIAVRSISNNVATTPRNYTPPKVRESTSPPVTTPVPPSRTRLPYPTGDYATPPDSGILHQGPFSPPSSPPSSLTKSRHMSISGLPSQGSDIRSLTTSPSGLPQSFSPPRTTSPLTLPPPSASQRNSSVSPTPRKRYTVALGEPLASASEKEREREQRETTPHSRVKSRVVGSAFSPSPQPLSSTDDESDDNYGANEETIGKASGRHAGLVPDSTGSNEASPRVSPNPRARPQSMYGSSTNHNVSSIAPLAIRHSRLRSRSTERFGASDTPVPITPVTGRFVDPLVLRKQTKEMLANTTASAPKVMPGKPKVPVGQLVAFFDQEK